MSAGSPFSTATGYRIAREPVLPSQRGTMRERRRPDPLAEIFEHEKRDRLNGVGDRAHDIVDRSTTVRRRGLVAFLSTTAPVAAKLRKLTLARAMSIVRQCCSSLPVSAISARTKSSKRLSISLATARSASARAWTGNPLQAGAARQRRRRRRPHRPRERAQPVPR